jgi:hypothetical protein
MLMYRIAISFRSFVRSGLLYLDDERAGPKSTKPNLFFWPSRALLARPERPGLYTEPVEERGRQTALEVRERLVRGDCDPPAFRAALSAVAPSDRDAWVDLALALGPIPADEPELPRGGVPYIPAGVDSLLRIVDAASVGPTDIFVDVGAGLGRAVAVVSLLTGAAAVGVEVQPGLVAAARGLAARLRLPRASFVEADARTLPPAAAAGTVFFLYCPFSDARLFELLARLEEISRTRTIRVCCLDLPLPPCPWLEPIAPAQNGLAIQRSVARQVLR